MNFEEINYKFNNISLNSLPDEIKFEFEKIINKYKERNIIITEKSKNCLFNKNLLNDFENEFKKGSLFVDIHSNQVLGEKKMTELMFERRIEKTKPYQIEGYENHYYKPKVKESIVWFFDKYYSRSFVEGYKSTFTEGDDFFESSKDERLVQSVYNVIKKHKQYTNLNSFYDDFFEDKNVIDPMVLSQFAKTEGKYIKAWEIVLQYPKRFVNLFIENTNNKINGIDWKGTPTELTALIKALRLSKKLDTSITENETVKRFEQFFNINLKAHSQNKTKISYRIKDYTPFLDTLKFNLENWIKSKDERKPSK